MGYYALLGTLVDGMLAKVDRASMAHSLEVGVPFLDHRVVEYAWRLPPALKYCEQAGSKHLLRRLLYRHLPPELVDHPKKGFSSPLPVWLRGPLREWADELLNERHLREEGLFEPTAVRACWKEHLAVSSDHWQLLWNVLVFRQWRSYWESDTTDSIPRVPLMSYCFSRATPPGPRVPRSAPRKAHAPPGQPAQRAPIVPPGGIAPRAASAHPARPHAESQPRVWLVLGDKQGDNAQVHAIERALGWSCERRHVQMREPWVVAKPRVMASLHHIDRACSDALEPPWPDLVITIGRRPSMVALWIAEQSGGRTKLVLVGKPSGMMRRFDLVIASAEINLPPFDNVVPIALPLMGVEESRIAAAVEVWRERLAGLPRPLVAFLIGGATRPFAFDRAVTERLIELARDVVVAGGTPYLSTSRRTSPTIIDALRDLPAAARLYRWTPGGPDNPYLGLLGLADGFVVTSDSISMLVEIIRLRRPLGILELRPRGLGRLDQWGHALIRCLCAPGTASAGSALGRSIAWGLHGLGLFEGGRDIPAFCRMLFERGLAVPAGAPLQPPRGEVPDDLGRVVARIRDLIGSGC